MSEENTEVSIEDNLEMPDDGAASTENTSTPDETPAAAEPAPGANGTALAEAELAAEEGEETPAFTPNVKYKVMDKEFEIPKQFQALMKDPESEKMVRELYEKAGGLDVVKEKLSTTRTERDRVQAEANNIKGSIDGLRQTYLGAVNSGNLLKLDEFFAKLKIPESVVMQYALAKVNFQELPNEQRQLIQSQMSSEKQAEELRQQNEQFQANIATQAQTMRMQMLDSVIANTEIAPVAQRFDAQAGKPGAFREAVRQYGEYQYSKGRDLLPEQAAQELIKGYSLQAGANPPQQTNVPQDNGSGAGGGQPSGKKVIQRTTQTIPNVQGRGGASPLKEKPRSIEDLKNLHKQMSAQ